MNSSSITGAPSTLVLQFEAVESHAEPSVPEIEETDDLEAAASDDQSETEAGLLRLAEFVKRRKVDKTDKHQRVIHAYETVKHFTDDSQVGTFLNRRQ